MTVHPLVTAFDHLITTGETWLVSELPQSHSPVLMLFYFKESAIRRRGCFKNNQLRSQIDEAS